MSWAEYHYNTRYHSSIGMTPYQAIYGRIPPILPSYTHGATNFPALTNDLITRDAILQRLRTTYESCHRMKQMADRGRQDQSFQEGEWVLVKLKPYRQDTVAHRQNFKLSKRFYGPFMIIEKVGSMAYTLQLPHDSSSYFPCFSAASFPRDSIYLSLSNSHHC